jgi:Alpha/beta hydrolase family
MATYVLVHGGGHGGWCYQRVARMLRSAGHEVHAPSLTGLAERSHLLGTHVDLDLHIQDIVALLRYEDLKDVILVGHSYGGMVRPSRTLRAPAALPRMGSEHRPRRSPVPACQTTRRQGNRDHPPGLTPGHRPAGLDAAMIVCRLRPRLSPADIIVFRYGRYTTRTAHNDPHVRPARCAWYQ